MPRRIIERGMSTDFKVTPHLDYVHVELAAGYEIKPEGTTALAMAISDLCTRQGQRRVLIEGTIARRQMATMDSFGVGSLAGACLPAFRSPAASTATRPTSRPNSSRTWRRTAACASRSLAAARPRCAGWG